jgi:hypothetical protein
VYQTALECVRNKDLRNEWTKYSEQTQNHVEVLTSTCASLGLDPKEMTPGRQIVKHNGAALLKAMKMAFAAGNPAAAELVACECVGVAETKDHFDWELIGHCAKAVTCGAKNVLQSATGQVEDEEDEHLSCKGMVSRTVAQSLGLFRGAAAAEKSGTLRRQNRQRRLKNNARTRAERRDGRCGPRAFAAGGAIRGRAMHCAPN